MTIALLTALPGLAELAHLPDPASIGRVEVTLDLPKDKPYVGEMILLRMRSFIRADVVLDHVEQPALANFSWQQLGRDRPIEAMIDGFSVTGIERDLALFPTTSGRLIIEPFTRHVTIVTSNNQRVEASFASESVLVDVQNYAAINPPDQWWLPAKSVTLTEKWSQTPDEIKPGTVARRTITIEAVGLTGDRLPPPPEMQSPGIIAFHGPVERKTILTEDGPIGFGSYVWDLRPVSSSPAKLPAIHVAWFDTTTRRMRDSALPDLWVALIGTFVHPSRETTTNRSLLSVGSIAVGAAGFTWTAALIGIRWGPRRSIGRTARRQRRCLAVLRRRARFSDATGFSQALADLARSDPRRWTVVSAASLIAPRLAALDRARFGRDGGLDPALKPLAADIRKLWLSAAPEHPDQSTLPPLDGDAMPTDRMFHRLRRQT